MPLQLQCFLLLLGLRLGLLLLFWRRLFVRVALANHLAHFSDDLVFVRQVGKLLRDDEEPDRHFRRKLAGQLHEAFRHRLAHRAGVVLLGHNKVAHAGGDVIDDAHRAVCIDLGLVDPQPLDFFLGAADPDHLALAHELLGGGQLLFAGKLGGQAQVVEGLGIDHAALHLASLDCLAAGCVGLDAAVVIIHAAGTLNLLGAQLHHLDLGAGHFRVSPDLHAVGLQRAGSHLHVTVRAAQLVHEPVDVRNGARLAQHLVGVEQEQRFAGALVQILLHVADAADHAIRQAITATAVAPQRRQGVAVVPVDGW